jgi:hypothetical protein
MRKDQLVRALIRSQKKPAVAARKSAAHRPAASSKPITGKSSTSSMRLSRKPAVPAKLPATKLPAAKARPALAKAAATNGHATIANGKPPIANGKPPIANGKPPIANGKPPIANGKPAADNGKSVHLNGNGKAALTNGKPLTPHAKPLTPHAKVVPTNGKTAPINGKAAATNGKPAATNGKPVLTNGKPAVPQAKAPLPVKLPVKLPPAKPVIEKPAKDSPVAKRLQRMKAKHEDSMDLSRSGEGRPGEGKDRLIVMVRDSYWLHAYWELSRQGVERARAALGQQWHATRPILRLLQISSNGTATAAESQVRDIEIHGGVNNWYVDVQDPPKSYRMEIGYRSAGGKFFVLARSNVVSTPRPGSKDAIDENWSAVAEDYDKIYALSGGYSPDGASVELQELFEERLRRPMGSPMVTHYATPVDGLVNRKREFSFELDAELIVYGVTEPNAHVTLQGDPVKLRPDGTFTVRFSLPNCRQVIPAVACSADGVEQRTVVLAVERNTKVMEPLIRDAND